MLTLGTRVRRLLLSDCELSYAFYKYTSPSTISLAVDAKPAFRLDGSDKSVIAPHVMPSGGKSVNLQQDAMITRAELAITGITVRIGNK